MLGSTVPDDRAPEPARIVPDYFVFSGQTVFARKNCLPRWPTRRFAGDFFRYFAGREVADGVMSPTRMFFNGKNFHAGSGQGNRRKELRGRETRGNRVDAGDAARLLALVSAVSVASAVVSAASRSSAGAAEPRRFIREWRRRPAVALSPC